MIDSIRKFNFLSSRKATLWRQPQSIIIDMYAHRKSYYVCLSLLKFQMAREFWVGKTFAFSSTNRLRVSLEVENRPRSPKNVDINVVNRRNPSMCLSLHVDLLSGILTASALSSKVHLPGNVFMNFPFGVVTLSCRSKWEKRLSDRSREVTFLCDATKKEQSELIEAGEITHYWSTQERSKRKSLSDLWDRNNNAFGKGSELNHLIPIVKPFLCGRSTTCASQGLIIQLKPFLPPRLRRNEIFLFRLFLFPTRSLFHSLCVFLFYYRIQWLNNTIKDYKGLTRSLNQSAICLFVCTGKRI